MIFIEIISHQINSALERIKGIRTYSMSLTKNLVAIGTTMELVLIFDRISGKLNQFINLKKGLFLIFIKFSFLLEYGAISALDFSPDSTKLAIGFNRGALVIYNCNKKRILNQFEEIMQSGRSILHVKYVTK